MQWVDQACCGFFAKEQAGTLKATDVYLFRVAQMLDDYMVHGAVLRRYSRGLSRLTGDDADTIARFRSWLRSADRAVSTVRTYATVAGEFLAFLDTRGGLTGCDAAGVQAFVATLAGYQFKTVEQKLCALRSFLRFASGEGFCRRRRPGRGPGSEIPQAHQDPVGVGSGRGDPDPGRGRPGQPVGEAGLRDHPADHQTGLRSIDVKRLEFSDFDWPGNRLSIVWAKTGGRVWLPLLTDVGWAVNDYVRSARPSSLLSR